MKDAIMVENMHDIPYVKSPLGPEIIAAMTRICSDVKKCLPASTPCGVQARISVLVYIISYLIYMLNFIFIGIGWRE